jgi:hypothetical protein
MGAGGGASTQSAGGGAAAGNGNTGALVVRIEPPPSGVSLLGLTVAQGSTVSGQGNVTPADGGVTVLSFEVLPAGQGYSVDVTGRSLDGSIVCDGQTGLFAIGVHQTVTETVTLLCSRLTGTIGPEGPGLEPFCGTWESVTTRGGIDGGVDGGVWDTSPADGVTPIFIEATANGPTNSALVYSWSVLSSTGAGVTLGSSTGNGTTDDELTVTCNPSAESGGAVVQLMVTDAPDGGAVICPSSLSTLTVPLTCEGDPCLLDAGGCADAGADGGNDP